MFSIRWGSTAPAQTTWNSTNVTDLLNEATLKLSTPGLFTSFQSALQNLSTDLAKECQILHEDRINGTTDLTIIDELRSLSLPKPTSSSVSPASSTTLTPVPSSLSIEVIVEHVSAPPVDQLVLLRTISSAIFNFHSAGAILSAVTNLDADAKERFLRHASEHAGYQVTEANLTSPESKKALLWALSEETSRYVSLTYDFNQDEWNLLDYFIYQADGTESNEPEFGKYHRMDGNLDSFLAQTQKVLDRRTA